MPERTCAEMKAKRDALKNEYNIKMKEAQDTLRSKLVALEREYADVCKSTGTPQTQTTDNTTQPAKKYYVELKTVGNKNTAIHYPRSTGKQGGYATARRLFGE